MSPTEIVATSIVIVLAVIVPLLVFRKVREDDLKKSKSAE